MKVRLNEVDTGDIIEAVILKAEKKDLPMKKDGWQFAWRSLGQIEGAQFYKLTTINTAHRIEGMLMLTLINDEMLYMNNIEVASHNYGSSGKYENVAGSLLGFACYQSFKQGKNDYLGFLSFESKTQLIKLYADKYGATIAIGQRMFFDSKAGKALMDKYLSIGS